MRALALPDLGQTAGVDLAAGGWNQPPAYRYGRARRQ